MAQTETEATNAHSIGRAASSSHPPRPQPQGPLAHGTVFNRNLAIASGVGLTNAWLGEQGLLSLKLSGHRLPTFVEPPDADPHVRWCREGHPQE